jgi:hypothetical protein
MSPRRLALLICVLASLVSAAPAHAIVGGAPTGAGPTAYPWQTAVVTADGDDTWLCGGTFVGRGLVLTAAHCVIRDDGQIVVPGDIRVLSGNTVLDDTTFSQVAEVALYPGLDLAATPSGLPSGDLALLRIPASAPGSALALATDPALWAVGARLRIAGWGITSAGTTAEVLNWASVFRDADEACTTAYGGDFVLATMFCASAPSGADTCSGDSGGPIIAAAATPAPVTDPAAWRLVGVTSWGTGCGDPGHPGVYTRLWEPALASFATDPEPVWAPVNLTRPAMPAGATVGEVVTCSPGTWRGEDLTFTYEFHRLAPGGSSTVVQSSASSTYAVGPADTSGLECVVYARNAGGTAWAQSGSTPVRPASVPPAQTPSPDTPRVPPPAAVVGQVVGTTDGASPRSSGARARCARRRCTVTVRVTDPSPSSGIRRVTGTVSWKASCRKGGRRTTCTKTRRVSARNTSGATWTFTLPRLPRGSAVISIVAVDRSGRLQRSPAKLRFRVR